MKFFYKMERKYGRYAIHNLMNYMIALSAAGVLLNMFAPRVFQAYFSLNARALLHGQVWRIVTFLMQPMAGDLFFNLLSMYLYYMLGTNLERIWGAFRFNVYIFMGVIGHVLAALVIYGVTGYSVSMGTHYLYMSLFLAFAATFPDMEFYLFFMIPIKAKYLAILDSLYFLQALLFGGLASRAEVILSLANFLIFFLMTRNYKKYSPKEIHRKQSFKAKMKAAGGVTHRCAVCGRTEEDGEDLVFRYCSKCEGNYEYCQDHLYTHQHVTHNKTTGKSE